jgi:hypothetical protein
VFGTEHHYFNVTQKERVDSFDKWLASEIEIQNLFTHASAPSVISLEFTVGNLIFKSADFWDVMSFSLINGSC